MRSVLTRAVAFHATHRYHKAGWDDAAHRARFGVERDAGEHGHLYRVDISVTGPLHPDTQMILDLAEFDAIIRQQVLSPLDGASLNAAVPAFASNEELPSCEAIAAWIWHTVAGALPAGVSMHRVRVAEDDTLWAECIG